MRSLFFGMALCLLAAGCAEPGHNGTATAPDSRPNILLVVVDDLGFNDLGLFGSEIETPNLDALARGGLTFTNFHAANTCSPTRAMLMTGADAHIVGLGEMAETLHMPEVFGLTDRVGVPGYEGYLNFRAATLPELLQDAGYNTYMTGKWHLGLTEETSPSARGFDRTFVTLRGGAGAFQNQLAVLPDQPTIYRENGKRVETLPEDFYSTRHYTDKMIEFIDSGLEDDRPFFAYLAHTSPHWPLQAPQESIARYIDRYDEGYDVLKQRRLARLKELGWFEPDTEPFPRMPGQRPWDDLSAEEKRYESRKMAIYAAMVDDIDVHVGRLVDHLKAIGEYDNTLIFFMSDNGPEGNDRGRYPGMAEFLEACCDNRYENLGNADSYVFPGPNWAQASNTPLRTFKGFLSQGGVLVPAFVHFPGAYPGARTSDAFLTVKDIMPTFLDLAEAGHPGEATYKGREVVAMQGRSMRPLFAGERESIREPDDYMGWHASGRRAIRQGDWKILYLPGDGPGNSMVPLASTNVWQLYNLADDPAETDDLADEYPEKLREMIGLWDDYVARNGVLADDR